MTTLVRARSNEIAILPGGTTSAIGDDTVIGPHTVVISGFVEVYVWGATDDDVCRTQDVMVDIEDVLWEPVFLQASTMTSWGEIRSADSDEVDHSAWGIRKIQTGHTDFVSGTITRKIRLLLELAVQGDGNTWRSIGFQIVANGTLKDIRAALASVNKTEEISSFGVRESKDPTRPLSFLGGSIPQV